MWIIRYAVAAVLIIGLLGFTIQNSYQRVVINAAFCIGLIFWFAISVIQYFRMMGQLSEQRKKNRTLTQEITTLRNLPLEEIEENLEDKS